MTIHFRMSWELVDASLLLLSKSLLDAWKLFLIRILFSTKLRCSAMKSIEVVIQDTKTKTINRWWYERILSEIEMRGRGIPAEVVETKSDHSCFLLIKKNPSKMIFKFDSFFRSMTSSSNKSLVLCKSRLRHVYLYAHRCTGVRP